MNKYRRIIHVVQRSEENYNQYIKSNNNLMTHIN